jgi:ligand-binding SRPBCC domain-containing protein
MARRSIVRTFVHRSTIDASAADVFRWHERPQAVLDLMPPRGVRLERRDGGIRNGDSLTFSMGVGPLRLVWEARHFGYVRDRQFCDEQVRGPFVLWRHAHRVEPIDAHRCAYEDRVEYVLPGGALVRGLADPLVRLLLTRMFVGRHHTVRTWFEARRRATSAA